MWETDGYFLTAKSTKNSKKEKKVCVDESDSSVGFPSFSSWDLKGIPLWIKGENDIYEMHDKLILSFADVCYETSAFQMAGIRVRNTERIQIF